MRRLTFYFFILGVALTFTLKAFAFDMHICGETQSARDLYYVGEGLKIRSPQHYDQIVHDINEIAANNDIRTYWDFAPWSRCEKGLISGKYHSILGANYTDERNKFIAFPRHKDGTLNIDLALMRNTYYLFVNKQITLDPKTTPIHLALPTNLKINKAFDYDNFRMVRNLKPKIGFKKLGRGSIHAYLSDEVIADDIIKNKAQFQNIERIEPFFTTTTVFMPVSRDLYFAYPNKIDKFWEDVALRFKNNQIF